VSAATCTSTATQDEPRRAAGARHDREAMLEADAVRWRQAATDAALEVYRDGLLGFLVDAISQGVIPGAKA